MRVAYMEFAVTDFSAWESVANGAMLVWLVVSAALVGLSVHRRLWFVPSHDRITYHIELRGVGVQSVSVARPDDRRRTEATATGQAFGNAHWWLLAPVGWCRNGICGSEADVRQHGRCRPETVGSLDCGTAATQLQTGFPIATCSWLTGGAVLLFAALVTFAIVVLPMLAESVRNPVLAAGVRYCLAAIGPLSLIMLAIVVLLPMTTGSGNAFALQWRSWAGPLSAAIGSLVVVELLGMRHPFVLSVCALGGFGIGALARATIREWQTFRAVDRGRDGAAVPRYVVVHHKPLAGRITSVGVLLIFAGFSGALLRTAVPTTLASGESRVVTDPFQRTWTFNSQGLSSYEEPDRRVRAVTVVVVHDGTSHGLITSEKRDYADSDDISHYPPITTVGRLATWIEDVHFAYSNNVTRETVNVVIYFNPLAVWLLVGGVLIAFGGAIVAFPPRMPTET